MNSPASTTATRGKRNKLIALVGAAAAAGLMVIVPKHEGTIPVVYRDPIGILTACTGHTGPELREGQTFTKAECDALLAGDLLVAAEGVKRCLPNATSDGEKIAYTSFAFNVGVKALCDSTIARLVAAGRRLEACAQLSRWKFAGGRVLPGLVKRRAEERAICESGVPESST